LINNNPIICIILDFILKDCIGIDSLQSRIPIHLKKLTVNNKQSCRYVHWFDAMELEERKLFAE
jgi:hypothetical protein